MALATGQWAGQHVRVVQDMKCLRDGSDMRNTPVPELAAVSDGGRSSTEHVSMSSPVRI